VFNHLSLDGYFTGSHGDFSWAHQPVPGQEWSAFVHANASSGGALLFGRITYQIMADYWPSPVAARRDAVLAEHINQLPKFVFSRTLQRAAWNNTTLLKGDLLTEVRRLKQESAQDLTILGSGTIVTQLAEQNLIDEYQLVVVPIVLGQGRTLFEGIRERLPLKLTGTRGFANGNALLRYEPIR
jgi:dihydrofolate reductase